VVLLYLRRDPQFYLHYIYNIVGYKFILRRGCAIGLKGKQVCKHYLNTFRALNIKVVGIKNLGL